MKYLIRLENTRTSRHDALLAFSPIPAGTVIGWGSDDHSPDGIAYWTVTSCEEVTAETYRVYIYYLRTAKHKDFDSKNDALNYAYDIANNNEKAMHITIENLSTCEKVLELYPER